MTSTARKNLRMSERTEQLISAAAAAQGTDFTSFVLEAASAKARRVLLEERALEVTPAEVAQIQALLSGELEPNDELRRAALRLPVPEA